MFAILLAAGLDPKKSAIFYQSAVCGTVLRFTILGFIIILTIAGSCTHRTNVDFELSSIHGIPIANDAVEGKRYYYKIILVCTNLPFPDETPAS